MDIGGLQYLWYTVLMASVGLLCKMRHLEHCRLGSAGTLYTVALYGVLRHPYLTWIAQHRPLRYGSVLLPAVLRLPRLPLAGGGVVHCACVLAPAGPLTSSYYTDGRLISIMGSRQGHDSAAAGCDGEAQRGDAESRASMDLSCRLTF